MKRFVAGLALVLATSGAWALPTVEQVEAAVHQGNYTQAETMMSEVVAAKPGSARAHYFYAELLAHNGSFARASQEAAKAKEIDPKIGFTDPDKFRSFEETLQREVAPKSRSSTSPVGTGSGSTMAPVAMTAAAGGSGGGGGGGIPGWVWLVGLLVLGAVLWKGLSRSRAAPMGSMATAGGPQGAYPYNNGMNQGAAPYGPNPGMPGAGMQGMQGMPGARPGGGLLGTGLAVAGGVAGGMLIDEMLHRHNEGGGAGSGIGNLGGLEPGGAGYGTGNDAAAQELESRPIDFGNGGNDWDSGGGSIDSGDSGGDSGGGWD